MNESTLTAEQLCERYYSDIYHWLCVFVGDIEQARDFTQETFYKALRALPQVHIKGSVSAWLYAIARNTVYDAGRQKQRRGVPLSLDALLADQAWHEPAAPAHADPANRYQYEDLWQAFAQLPEKYRQVLSLCVISDLSIQEAAAQLGCSPATLKSRLSRARHVLRQRYQQARV